MDKPVDNVLCPAIKKDENVVGSSNYKRPSQETMAGRRKLLRVRGDYSVIATGWLDRKRTTTSSIPFAITIAPSVG